MPKPQKTSTSSVNAAKKQKRKKDRAEAIGAAKNRKNLTGRDHQGNHDSATKQTKRHDDRHDHGVKVAGRAG
jgi:hypothetical protein